MTQIKFGTDGWRGLIADDFTFDNVRRVAGAIASYVLKHEDPTRGVIIGYDTRFLSDRAARAGAQAIAAGGGRRHDPLEPQSVELEWREVQSQVWRLGHARDHEVHRRRTSSRSDAQSPPGENRRSGSEAPLRRSRFAVRRSRPHPPREFQICHRLHVRLRPRSSSENI